MGNRGRNENGERKLRGEAANRPQQLADAARPPAPSASYRRRAWVEFQRALDPLAPIKPLPRQRP
jgi:hypothetical protein